MSNEITPDSAVLDRARRPIVYRVPQMDEVIVHANLKYTAANEDRLLMDVYVPPGRVTNSKHAAVVMIHGGVPGPFPVKEMGTFRSWGRLLAAKGFTGVAFTHRLRWPPSQLEDAAADVRSAIDYVRANAVQLGVDVDRIGVMTWSAGGLLLPAVLENRPDYIRCVVGLYPLLNESWVYNLNTPMLIARAGQDAVPGLNEMLDRFVLRATAEKALVTMLNHPTGAHGFDVETDDERTKEIIESILAFIGAHTR